MSPRFLHSCPDCVFLGYWDLHDLYYCRRSHNVVARFDNDDRDFKEGLGPGDYHLDEALERARDQGLCR